MQLEHETVCCIQADRAVGDNNLSRLFVYVVLRDVWTYDWVGSML